MAAAALTGAGNVTGDDASTGRTITLDKPANTADGDLLVAVTWCRETLYTTLPSGWSVVNPGVDVTGPGFVRFWYKPVVTASSEPASYTWDDAPSSGRHSGMMFRVTGADLTAPVDVAGDVGTLVTAAADFIDLPGVTTTADAALLLALAGAQAATGAANMTFTATGMTVVGSHGMPTTGTHNDLTVLQESVITASATGERTATASGTGAMTGLGYMIAIKSLVVEETVTGTIVEWNSTADTAPTQTVGDVTYPGGDVIEIGGGEGSAHVRWNAEHHTENAEMSCRFYAKYDDAWATGTVHLMSWFADTGSTLIGRLAVTSDGLLRMVNASGSTISTSPTPLPLNTWLRYEVEWFNGGLTVSVYATTLTQLLSLGPAALAASTWQSLWLGHTNFAQNPPTLSLANIIATDSAADSPIGPRVGDAAAATPVFHIVDGLLVPMMITML